MATDPGSLREPMAEQMWLELFREAVQEIAGGKPDFVALFTGNKFDLAITFSRREKGILAELLDGRPPTNGT